MAPWQACLCSARPMVADVYPVTLRFMDGQREQVYLDRQRTKLQSRLVYLLFMLLVYAAARTAIDSALGGADVDTTTDDGRLLHRARLLLLLPAALVVSAWFIFSCSSFGRRIRPEWYELISTIAITVMPMLVTVFEPWYLAKLCGIEPKLVLHEVPAHHDLELLLHFSVWITACHFMLPLRWMALLPLQVSCTLVYFVFCVGLGSCESVPEILRHGVMLVLLIFAVSVGKRDLETSERNAFLEVAQERVLRAQAEQRLYEAGGDQPRNNPPREETDAGSITETTLTGQIFNPSGLALQEQLGQIQALGTQEHWVVQRKDLQLQPDAILGQGSFGLVVNALYHGARVAVKMPRVSSDWLSPSMLVTFSQELRIFRRLRHPNVVLFYGAFVDPVGPDMALVLEYVEGSPLREVVAGPCSSIPACQFRFHLTNDVCCALRYLHAQRPAIIHGDIKDSNVLVERLSSRRRAKLLDFGLSRLLTPRAKDLGGTVHWMAPEVITKREGALSLSADIFSLGRLIYYMTAGQMPLHGIRRKDIIASVWQGHCHDLVWPEQALLAEQAKSLVTACTAFDPSSRPGIVGVQTILRGWGASAQPAALSTVLSKAAPLSEPDVDFGTALNMVRTRCRSRRRGGDAEQLARGTGAGSIPKLPDLMYGAMEETPEQTRVLSLLTTLTSWNAIVLDIGCCDLHALVEAAQLVLDKVKSAQCASIKAGDGEVWQCTGCKLLHRKAVAQCPACAGAVGESTASPPCQRPAGTSVEQHATGEGGAVSGSVDRPQDRIAL